MRFSNLPNWLTEPARLWWRALEDERARLRFEEDLATRQVEAKQILMDRVVTNNPAVATTAIAPTVQATIERAVGEMAARAPMTSSEKLPIATSAWGFLERPDHKDTTKTLRPFAVSAQVPRLKATTTTAEMSQFDIYAVERLTDQHVIPAPRSSDVKKIDTSVHGYWESNPNAAEEIQLAARLPLVDNQIREIIQHLITSRPSIQGPPKLVEHIRQWMEVEMELSTGHTRGLDRFVTDVAKQMLYYGMAPIFKQRTLSAARAPIEDPFRPGRSIAPLWGYAVMDMATVEVFLDKKHQPHKWRQSPNLFGKKPKEYPARDVFLARLPTQNSSLYFWTPSFVMPAFYAVTVLKALHQTIDAHTRGIVDILYYAQVGDAAYQNGTVTATMINDIKNRIDNSPRGSTPVFPWWVSLEKLDLDEYIDQLTKAAEFWEREVRRGVGGSRLNDGIGDSATRNTSDALTEKEMRAAQALVPEIQRAFRWMIMDKLAELPEFDISKITSWEDIPALVFEEIDMTQQIRRETHYLQLWQSDGLKHGEFRKSISRDEDPERVDKYFTDIVGEKAEAQAATAFDNTLRLENEKAKIKSQTTPGGTPRPKRPKD